MDLPVYFDSIGMRRPAITLDTIGYDCFPIYNTVFYKLFSNYDLSFDISTAISTASTRCWLFMVVQLRSARIAH